ncbi:Hypothetical predicted protein [Pelobates cultripes]|uniref:Uncharacterized protein n=1 Tax=Pelobates cultripes TaxID=61616 RepID=A0AAD1RAF6_PELCU|nr:Hypothetical predicted protein [Pelobates cultripes]
MLRTSPVHWSRLRPHTPRKDAVLKSRCTCSHAAKLENAAKQRSTCFACETRISQDRLPQRNCNKYIP